MIKNKKVFLDIDGVLADFDNHFLNYYDIEDKTPCIKWDDERITKNFHKCVNDKEFTLSAPRIMDPTKFQFKVSGYCTNRPIEMKIETEKWLAKNGFPYAQVYFCKGSKVDTLKKHGCDIFLEDNVKNFEEINQSGIRCYLMDRTYNRETETHLRVNDVDDFNIRVKPTVLILGYKEHGKTTLAKLIKKYSNLTFEDSSMASAKIFIYDYLKDKYSYKDLNECFVDRRNRRKEWFDLISNYNSENKTRLAEDILKMNNMYVGMRREFEIKESINKGLFDIIISIYDPRKEHENSESCDIDILKMGDFVIWNDGDLNDLETKVKKIFYGK